MYQLTNITYKQIINIPSLTIKQEEIVCIVGPSGSGKTTILKMLNKMLSPDTGTILYHGNDLASMDSIHLRRSVAMLPQTPTIYPGNILHNLTLPFTFSKREFPSHDTLIETLEAVGITKELSTSTQHLSGGEKQRLALARLLLLHPDVFLLDEPSSALDAKAANALIELVVDYVKKHHKSLIMITHSDELANQYAERILEIQNGQICSEQTLQK